MAGSLTASSIHQRRRSTAAVSALSRWVIGFAKFVPFPFAPPPCPILTPIGKRELNPSPHGTWLSTSYSSASLQLVNEVNRSDVILSVSLGGIVLEEHYISNLNFSWPQMSCVSGFPPRGSRVILVSYNDSANELQKFALRFSTCDAAETFVIALKEKLKGIEEVEIQRSEAGIQRSETRSEISFQTDYNPSNENIYRAAEVDPGYSYVPEEVPNMARPLEIYVPEMLPRLEYETGQAFYQPQSAFSQISRETPINLPPSFTTLLSGCLPNSTLDAGQTSVKQDPDLKSQILKYMEDSSFQDMLQKVERIIDEIGGNNWIA